MSRVSGLSTTPGAARPWQDRHVTDAGTGPPAAGAPRPGGAARRRELIYGAAMAARLQQNAYDRFEDAVAGYFGVNRTAMRCLEVLDRLGQQTAGELATQTGLTSGAVTAMLDRLERAGLVRRLADASDRRRVLVQMTDRAAQLAADVYEPLAEEMAEFERYTDDQLRLLAEFLQTATRTLERHAGRVEQQRRDR